MYFLKKMWGPFGGGVVSSILNRQFATVGRFEIFFGLQYFIKCKRWALGGGVRLADF